ncbi:hypothetical protein [Luteibacter aegosomatissinici]|uniref:hypothetical protein n=1 Tax=Luteibacter aegosomatissinici TaxID=2911539 RepID=UPI001FFA369F|nr:hypothetical protein [Luteibacter aegosomatissinici]UPG92825.1 hypothetical protein L2Y97_13215 [Luteibacter aegosomatissinici]
MAESARTGTRVAPADWRPHCPLDDVAVRIEMPCDPLASNGFRSTWWQEDRTPCFLSEATLLSLLGAAGRDLRRLPPEHALQPGQAIVVNAGHMDSPPHYFTDMDDVRRGTEREWAARLWTFELVYRLRRTVPSMDAADIDDIRAALDMNNTGSCFNVPGFMSAWARCVFGEPAWLLRHDGGYLSESGWRAASSIMAVHIPELDDVDGMSPRHPGVAHRLIDEINRSTAERFSALWPSTQHAGRPRRL